MKRYGNIRFNRRMVAFVCMLVVAVSVLMPLNDVLADTVSSSSSLSFNYREYYTSDSKWHDISYTFTGTASDSSPVYSYIVQMPAHSSSGDTLQFYGGFVSTSSGVKVSNGNVSFSSYSGVYFYQTINKVFVPKENHQLSSTKSDIYIVYNESDSVSPNDKIVKYVTTGEKSDGMIIGGSGYMPNNQSYSEIGCLDNVQMETYVTNKKELIDADENADLSKINQDKVIVYSSSTTTGIDLSKGGYRVQLYGSYAWQDKSGNIKSEDKGHKTFIKDWDAQDNIKGLDRSKYKWIDWKTANDKVEADKTDKAHKPNAFEKMTTYANYQYEPIWYLRIVSQDNKYGAWVKLYNSTNKGKYRSESVDDDDNAVPDSGGGYNKPKDTSEISGTGDTPEDAKNNVPKAEEKQDNDDLNDSANGNNSTFDKLEQFTKGIGDVPKMIADIFSFLPSWCLDVVAIGFALLMILIVVKFIRG